MAGSYEKECICMSTLSNEKKLLLVPFLCWLTDWQKLENSYLLLYKYFLFQKCKFWHISSISVIGQAMKGVTVQFVD